MNKKDKRELREWMEKGCKEKEYLKSICEDRVRGTGVPAPKTMKTIITIEYDGKSENFENSIKKLIEIAHGLGLWGITATFKRFSTEKYSHGKGSEPIA